MSGHGEMRHRRGGTGRRDQDRARGHPQRHGDDHHDLAPLAQRRRELLRAQEQDQQAGPHHGYYYNFPTRKTLGNLTQTIGFSTLWERDIKTIEGRYGSGVGTYFRFLKFLFWLNAFLSLLSLSFVFIPQILERILGDYAALYDPTFHFEDIFTGDGWFNTTELFFAGYKSGNVTLTKVSYDMIDAYFYTVFTCFFLMIIIMSLSMARSYRQNFIDIESERTHGFCHKIFGAWDFAVAGVKAGRHGKRSCKTQLAETLDKVRGRDNVKKNNVVPIVVINVFTLGLIGGTAYATYAVYKELQDYEESEFLKLMGVPLLAAGVMLLLPLVFSLVSPLEEYSKRTETYVNMLRTVALGAATLVPTLLMILNETDQPCWENRLGQEMYRFVTIFLYGVTLVTLIFETIFMLLSKKFEKIRRPEFDTARNTVYLIFGQTATWLGFYSSPLLPFVFVLVLLITFYLNKLTLYLNCRLPETPWRAAQSYSIIKVTAFFAMIGTLVSYAYVIGRVESSEDCGPFQDVEIPYEVMASKSRIQDVIPIFHPAVVAGLIVILVVVNYYLLSLAVARRKHASVLRQRIRDDAQQKQFLIVLMRSIASKLRQRESSTAQQQ